MSDDIFWQKINRGWHCSVDVPHGDVWTVFPGTVDRRRGARRGSTYFLDLPEGMWTEEASWPAFEKWFASQFGRLPRPHQKTRYPLLRAAGWKPSVDVGARDCEVERQIHDQHRVRQNSTVYFLEAVGTARVKIGWSVDFLRRQKDIQACCPVPTQVIHTERGGKPQEKSLHLKFAACRLHGEWFVLSDEIRDYVAHGLHAGGLS